MLKERSGIDLENTISNIVSNDTQSTYLMEDRVNRRVLSDILFPYTGLEEAITIVQAMHNYGGVPMTKDQVAAAMDSVGMSLSISALSARISAAIQFGLLDKIDRTFSILPLGELVISDQDEERTSAKVEAFQKPDLYRKLIEHFRNRSGKLPGKDGLENVIENFGVSDRQKDRARQVFEKSAIFAGFLNQAKDRLSMPVTQKPSPPQTSPEPSEFVQLPVEIKRDPSDERLIRGMLDLLPPVGEKWKAVDRVRWLKRMSTVLGALYDQEDDTEIKITIQNPADG